MIEELNGLLTNVVAINSVGFLHEKLGFDEYSQYYLVDARGSTEPEELVLFFMPPIFHGEPSIHASPFPERTFGYPGRRIHTKNAIEFNRLGGGLGKHDMYIHKAFLDKERDGLTGNESWTKKPHLYEVKAGRVKASSFSGLRIGDNFKGPFEVAQAEHLPNTINENDYYIVVSLSQSPSNYDLTGEKWLVINLEDSEVDKAVKWMLEARKIANDRNVSLIKQVVFTNSDDVMAIEQKFDSTGVIVVDYSGKSFIEALSELEQEVKETQQLIEEQRRFQGF